MWCAHHGRSLEDVKSPGGSPRRHLGTEEHEPARTPPPPRLPAVRPAHARQGRRDHHPPLVRAGTLRPPGRPVRQPAHSALTRPLRVFQPRRPNQQNPATGNPTRIQLPNGTPRPAQTLRRISRTQTLNVPPQRTDPSSESPSDLHKRRSEGEFDTKLNVEPEHPPRGFNLRKHRRIGVYPARIQPPETMHWGPGWMAFREASLLVDAAVSATACRGAARAAGPRRCRTAYPG